MGMFDYVNFMMPCPECGTIVRNFQSKDRECFMDLLEINEVWNMYSSCSKCGRWIELSRLQKVDDGTKEDKPPAQFADATLLGFRLLPSQERDA